MYVGAILLTVQFALKQAAGPAAASALVMVPMFMFQKEVKARFLRSFEDAALLQTSLLDGWDNSLDYTMEKREEYRQFLVDAHKAAYVSTFQTYEYQSHCFYRSFYLNRPLFCCA